MLKSLKSSLAPLETGSKFGIHFEFASMHDEKEKLQPELCALLPIAFVPNCQLINKGDC
jgi:hypothetical protein